MKLAGTLTIGNEQNIIFVDGNTTKRVYSLYSSIANSDRLAVAQGLPTKLPVKLKPADFKATSKEKMAEIVREYFVGAIEKRVTGVVNVAGTVNEIRQALGAWHFAETYHFSEESIQYDDTTTAFGATTQSFAASDEHLSLEFERFNSDYRFFKVQYGAIKLELESCGYTPGIAKEMYSEASDTAQEEIVRATLQTIHYSDLERCLDMSWYRKDGKTLKEYRAVHSIEEFEDMFSMMMEAACNTDQLVIALDTETTGINIYDLSKENPARDHCVEISISWEEDKAYCIFNDMEYFNNVSAGYCFKRLAEIFTEERDEFRITWNGGKRSEVFPRDRFHLVGQNFPFDRRVSCTEGYPLWFDDDTLNMGFNIDPKSVRGSVKLKNMTRRVFGHETPELSDVLGKGNEDKYRWLADEEVATIYAGADADYTRKLYFVLKKLLGEKMYYQYHKQDVKMLNILPISEYEGLRVKEKEAKELAIKAEENLAILQRAAYEYVGAYMSYKQNMDILCGRYDSGLITEEEFKKCAREVKPDKNAVYEFEFKAADIRSVMFDILKYPVIATTDTGLPKVDKYTRKKLLATKRSENSNARKLNKSILVSGADYSEYERLMNGSKNDKKKAESMELVSMKEFNSKEYPIALMFEKYAVLNKEYTSYYKPILEGNLEGKILKSYSLARIETRRIMNASQTMKKDLKKLVIPYSDEYYSLDFDLSQIEVRLMYSLSGSEELIQKMKNPENDVHTETAAMVNQKKAYLVTKDERKGAKKVSFGLPYGLGDRSLCEQIYDDVTDIHMAETRVTLHRWGITNHKVIDLLEAARAQALEPVEISLEKRNFMDAWKRDEETKEYLLDENGQRIPKILGAVYNELGFCRYFDISDIDQSLEAKQRRAEGKYTPSESTIRRAAGNYPIQSYAAEFFRIILYRFYDRCKKEGIADKVRWNMLIHDELLASVHKSVNPILMMKIVKEACMITMPGHTNYFVGINIGDNWKETKDDAREAPVNMVTRLIKRWDAGEFREQTWFDHPWEFIKPLRDEYVENRIHEGLLQAQPTLDEKPIEVDYILKHYDNYTVRAYVYDYARNFEIPKGVTEDEEDNLKFLSCLETWAISVYGEGKEIRGFDGKIYRVQRGSTLSENANTVEEEEDDFAKDDFFDDFEVYDYDEEGIIDTYFEEQTTMDTSNHDEINYDFTKYDEAKNVADLTITEKKYDNLKVLNGCLIISLDNDVQMEYLKGIIRTGKGQLVMFKRAGSGVVAWKKIESTANLAELDATISNLRNLPKGNARCINDKIIFETKSQRDVEFIMKGIQVNKGFGYKVFVQSTGGLAKPVGQVKPNTDFSVFKEEQWQLV